MQKISSKCVNMLLSHQIFGHRCQRHETTLRFVVASGTSKSLISVLIELLILLSFVKETSIRGEMPPSYMVAVEKNLFNVRIDD